MRRRFSIGIDPGVNTGFAVYSREEGRILSAETLSFWEAYDRVLTKYSPLDAALYIECPSLNRPTFDHGEERQKSRERISRNVGGNAREGTLLAERFEAFAFEVHRIRPTSAKWTPEQIARHTGYTARTSEHSRDAIKIVHLYGR